ncbi:hypothetical protein Pcinc_027346 [Petrolisthes cinctipes]|uniref:MD-2-related lipid-recognition domain-containing protein n=1 Tax=Petrolisthes cinctipes TaxID=88211 RepID=A0AAE1F441_PETCI|nr:hypothetical protein Pcinc_027346 [Petrolisthes cinctipes]
MKTCFISVALLATLVSVNADAAIKKCGGVAQVNTADVVITGCKGHTRCIFKKNTFASIQLPFTLNQEFPSVTAKVYGVIAGVKIPFPFPHSNACANSGLQCPLTPGSYSYTSKLLVQPAFPSLDVDVEWHLVDGNNQEIVCIRFPVALQ